MYYMNVHSTNNGYIKCQFFSNGRGKHSRDDREMSAERNLTTHSDSKSLCDTRVPGSRPASTPSGIISYRVCGICTLGIGEGANAIISNYGTRLDSRLLRLSNWSVLL